MSSIKSVADDVFSAIRELSDSHYDRQIQLIESEMLAAEEAAGVRKKSAVETAQAEYDAAKAKYAQTGSAADKAILDEADRALRRAKIEEEYAKKKAQLEYQQAQSAWEMGMVQIWVNAAIATMKAWASLDPSQGAAAWVAPALMSTAIDGAAIAETVIMDQHKPTPPKFAAGTGFSPAGIALVGERGPELVQLPQGAKVKTAGETRSAMGNTFHFHSPVVRTPVEERRALEATMRRMAFEGTI